MGNRGKKDLYIVQGACENGMAHGNTFFKLRYRIDRTYTGACLASPPPPPLVSMGAPVGGRPALFFSFSPFIRTSASRPGP